MRSGRVCVDAEWQARSMTTTTMADMVGGGWWGWFWITKITSLVRFVSAAESPAHPRKRYIFQSPGSEIGTVERIRPRPLLWLRKVKRIKVSDKIMDQDQIDLCPWFDCFSSNKHRSEYIGDGGWKAGRRGRNINRNATCLTRACQRLHFMLEESTEGGRAGAGQVSITIWRKKHQ